MLPLFDMMMQAQNGAAVDAMAKQFNLAQEQATKAMAALMPAFSSGLKRTTVNPSDFMGLMQSVGSGNYAKYFEDVGKAFTPEGIADGNAVLGQLFGSKDVPKAVAAQAAQMTDIGQEIYKKMLPVISNALMGGLFKQATGQTNMAVNPFVGTAMGEMVQTWLESTGFARKQKPAQEPSIFDNPFTQSMQLMFGMNKPTQASSGDAANPFLNNPFMQGFQAMMANAGNKPEQKEAPEPAPGAEMKDYSAMMSAMFDSGLEVQKNYQKNMESIFETYLQNGQAAPAAKKPDSK